MMAAPTETSESPDATPTVDPGLRKVAVAMLLLGDELSQELFRLLDAQDVRRVLGASKSLRDVSETEVISVLNELVEELDTGVVGVSGHAHRIEEAAVSVFGADLINAVASGEVSGSAMQIHSVAVEKPVAFAKTLEREHPQAIAVVLSLLAPHVGANVLRHLSSSLKTDVLRRIANLRSVSAAVLAGVTESVGREFGTDDEDGPVTIDGTQMAVKLLKSIGSGEEQALLDSLAEIDADLSETIRNQLFTFEDLVFLHDRDLQNLMREIDQRTLPLALKTASEELTAKLLGNVSSRAAAMLKDDMAALGPVTVSQVEEAQQLIVQQVMELGAAGRINIRPGETV